MTFVLYGISVYNDLIYMSVCSCSFADKHTDFIIYYFLGNFFEKQVYCAWKYEIIYFNLIFFLKIMRLFFEKIIFLKLYLFFLVKEQYFMINSFLYDRHSRMKEYSKILLDRLLYIFFYFALILAVLCIMIT